MKEENAEKNLKLDEVTEHSQLLSKRSRNIIITAVIAIVVIILAIFGTKKWYLEPREETAAEQIFAAENWFGQDNYELALNGNEEFLGFADVADEYGHTKAGNRAKYCAGICQLRLGKYQEAIDYLKSYKSKDVFTSVQAIMLQGDAQLELGNTNEAIALYEKAAKASTDYLVAPAALQKAGMAYMIAGNNAKAIECFKQIKTNYPESVEWAEVDKYIAYAEASNK